MAGHGKRYQDAAKLVDRDRVYPIERGGRARARDVQPSSSTPRWRPTSASASTPATPTRWSAAPSSCRTAPARSSASPSSPRARRPRRRCAPAPTRSAPRTWSRRSRPAGSSSTSRSRPRTSMGQVGRLGRILGRRGLMPNPKAGHDHVRPRARGPRGQGRPRRVQGRQGRDHPRPVRQGELRGRRSWPRTWPALVDAVNRAKPAGAKGQYLRTLTIATHDGPRHPGRHPGRPGGRGRLDHCHPSPPAPPPAGAERHNKTDGSPQTACARGRRARREATVTAGA